MSSHHRSSCIVPAALGSDHSITIYDLLNAHTMPIIRAVEAYDTSDNRIIAVSKALTDSQLKLVFSIGISEPPARADMEAFIKSTYD